MKPKVYIETSIVSYLVSRPSRDHIQAAHQKLTKSWWDKRRRFVLFTSNVVLREASLGDPRIAARRLAALDRVALMHVSEEAMELAAELVRSGGLPRTAAADAFHIAVATVHGMDYLLTWNCKHIANALLRGRIETVCRAVGFEPPVICTPEELTPER